MTSLGSEAQRALRGADVLVTGATGFIGRHLTRTLREAGARVDGLSRTADEDRLPPGVRPVRLDLTDRAAVAALADTRRYDTAVHLAGLVDARPDRELVGPAFDASLAAAVNLLMAAHDAGWRRVVLVGSLEETPSAPDLPLASPYAAAKASTALWARMFHRLYGLGIVMPRLSMVYGPGQPTSKVVPFTIRKLLSGEKVPLSSGSKVCDPIYVDDAVAGIIAAAVAGEVAEGKTFDLGAGSGLTVGGLVRRVVELMGKPGALDFGALPDRAAEAGFTADLGPARSMLGWEPTWTLDAGLRETIEWYRGQLAGEPAR